MSTVAKYVLVCLSLMFFIGGAGLALMEQFTLFWTFIIFGVGFAICAAALTKS